MVEVPASSAIPDEPTLNVTVGKAWITIALFAPIDPAAPGVASVNVALFPAASLMVPLFSASEPVAL